MLEIFSKRRLLKLKLSIEGLIVGIFTGIIISAFRFLIDEADIYRPKFFEILKTQDQLSLWLATIILIIFTACILSTLIKIDKQIAGSGVPQIKGILQNKLQMFRPLRLVILKFFASTLAISVGMSLGRAGLSVQFGACIGNFFNNLIGRQHQHISNEDTFESKYLLIAGAGAGLAAIFNAPLAGVIFCVEELQKKFSPELLIVSMTAAVSSSAVVEFVFGIKPVFETITPSFSNIPMISTLPTSEMLLTMSAIKFLICLIFLGSFVGFLGSFFTKMLIFSLDFYDKIKINGTKKFLIPLILIIPIGLMLPEILGCGNILVDKLLSKNFSIELLIILFVSKFLFTMICFGTNAPGGIFLPLLVLGALSGNIFASLGIAAGIFNSEWLAMFIIFAMAAYFAAVVKAPITGSILIMELTGNFYHLLALMIVSHVAFLISDLCGGKPAYSALLERQLKHSITSKNDYKRSNL